MISSLKRLLGVSSSKTKNSSSLIPISKARSELWSWGENSDGQLGLRDFEYRKIPQPIQHFGAGSIDTIGCGLSHSATTTADGIVWLWGSNLQMQIGMQGGIWDILDDEDQQNYPNPLGETSDFKIKQVALGYWHTMLLTATGTLQGLGNGCAGQLGKGDKFNYGDPQRLVFKGEYPISVACGGLHTLTLTDEGNIYAWGHSFNLVPTKLEKLGTDKFQLIACGAFHSLCVKGEHNDSSDPNLEEDEVFTVGSGIIDSISKPNDPYSFEPKNYSTDITRASLKEKVISISCGVNCNAAVTEGGLLYLWNCGDDPQLVQSLKDKKIVQVALSGTDCAGELVTWTIAENGDLLDFQPKSLLAERNVESVSLGWGFGLAKCAVPGI